ncbi:MAG: peptide deformylase [Bacteroidota bacterium]
MRKIILLFSLFIFLFLGCKKDEVAPVVPVEKEVVDPLKFTTEELNLFTVADSATLMELMYFHEQPDSVILRKISTNINLNEPQLDLLLDRMYTTVRNPSNQGVGIAAPQVGINRRICWVKRYDKAGYPWQVIINAKITALSDTVLARADGCLSIPGESGNSLRAIWCTVEYDEVNGTHKIETIKHAYTAHIFQHEIDHLDGIVWLDRLAKKKNIYILKSEEQNQLNYSQVSM